MPDEHQGGDCRNELIDTTDPFNCGNGRPEGGYSFETQRWDRECSQDYCENGDPKQTIDGAYGANCEEYVAPEQSCEEQGLVTDPQTEECLTQDAFCAKYPDAEGCTQDPEEPEECVKPDGTPTGATPSSGCEQCPDGYTFGFDGVCQPDGGSINCEEYNRETNEDGTCGGCLPGFQKDTTLPNEPCVKIFDGCPAGFELVNGECTAVSCPEGQEFCESTGQCEEPQNCPGGSSEGNSGGGGGGFGLNLDIAEIGISGDPQLLGRQRFGAQDFLTPLFTGNQGGGTDFPIARFLPGKGDIV